MTLGLTPEHLELAAAVRGWAQRHCPAEVVRAAVDPTTADGGGPYRRLGRARPWPTRALLGLHLPEKHGGQGFGLPELAVAVEELGRALLPGALPRHRLAMPRSWPSTARALPAARARGRRRHRQAAGQPGRRIPDRARSPWPAGLTGRSRTGRRPDGERRVGPGARRPPGRRGDRRGVASQRRARTWVGCRRGRPRDHAAGRLDLHPARSRAIRAPTVCSCPPTGCWAGSTGRP